jgi:Ca2+-binding RTX toxin-like protein
VGNPIYIFAGQSNALNLADGEVGNLEGVLEDWLGHMDFHAVLVAAPGVPLTRNRNGVDDWHEPDELRMQLVDQIKAVLAEDPEAYLSDLIWVQGEADTGSWNAAAEGYADYFASLIQEVRDEVGNDPAFSGRDTGADSFRVLVSELSNNAGAAGDPERAHWQTVIEAQREVARDGPLISTLDPDLVARLAGFPADRMFWDDLHYSETFDDLLSTELLEKTAAPDLFALGTSGADKMQGSRGDNVLVGARGNDSVQGYAGDDTLKGGTGKDELRGGTGNDDLFGALGRDYLNGGHGADILKGGRGSDRLIGGGGEGRDLLLGNGGRDHLRAGAGNDILDGGRGDDVLIGGAGSDLFVFRRKSDVDVIRDFEVGVDRLDLSGFSDWFTVKLGDDYTASDVVVAFGADAGAGLVLDLGYGDRLVLAGVSSDQVASALIAI